MSEELENKLAGIQQLAKEDPNIDATTLMINALEQEHQDLATAKHKKWAYFISISLPPLGYGCAIYYRFFSSTKDRIGTAWWCAGLTTFTIIVSLFTLHIITNAATQVTGQQFNVQQFQQTPDELRAVLQN